MWWYRQLPVVVAPDVGGVDVQLRARSGLQAACARSYGFACLLQAIRTRWDDAAATVAKDSKRTGEDLIVMGTSMPFLVCKGARARQLEFGDDSKSILCTALSKHYSKAFPASISCSLMLTTINSSHTGSACLLVAGHGCALQ